MTVAESESDNRITTDTAYLAPMDELQGVYCEDFGENWQCYNGTALYYMEQKSSWFDLIWIIDSLMVHSIVVQCGHGNKQFPNSVTYCGLVTPYGSILARVMA